MAEKQTLHYDPEETLTINTTRSLKHYRCKNGHEQITYGEHEERFSVTFSILNPLQEKRIYCCPLCLADALAKIAVPMEEVLDDA